MDENRFAQSASARDPAGQAASLPAIIASFPGFRGKGAAAEKPDADEHAFTTEAEENAYWQGVADGIRNEGGIVPPRLAARAAKQQLLVQWHDDPPRDGEGNHAQHGGGGSLHAGPAEDPLRPGSAEPSPHAGEDILDFTPTHLRHRIDGWTPERQREFVEALADTGIVRAAAARVGMTEQSVSRLRRRADARGFDRACIAAHRIGARRIHSIAYERAIEGTVKRHYFHGELKAEERVYDNRLLIALLGKLPSLHEPDPEADAIAANWEPWMEAIEQGLDAPPEPEPEPEPEMGAGDEPLASFDGSEVWEDDDGAWWTCFPPPAGFDGYEKGSFGEHDYQRRLSPQEQAVIDADVAEELREEAEKEAERRDEYFGFEGGLFSPRGPEPTSLSRETASAPSDEEAPRPEQES